MYWVLHAPRQTGKTTFLQTWMREINASGEAIACYVSVEACQGIPEGEKAIPLVCQAIRNYAKDFEVPVPELPTGPNPGQKTLEEALTQVSRYRATVGDRNTPTYVALFDRTPAGWNLSWEERLTWECLETESGPVSVMGA